MHKPGCAVLKNLIALGGFALVLLPVSAQRISADAVRNGHFPQTLRGHLDRSPNKSIHHLSSIGKQVGPKAAAAAAKHAALPRPIVSSFFYPSSRSGSVNYGFLVGNNPFSDEEKKRASVKTFVVPLVIKVHQVATDFSVDANNNLILSGIKDQDATYDPPRPARACATTTTPKTSRRKSSSRPGADCRKSTTTRRSGPGFTASPPTAA